MLESNVGTSRGCSDASRETNGRPYGEASYGAARLGARPDRREVTVCALHQGDTLSSARLVQPWISADHRFFNLLDQPQHPPKALLLKAPFQSYCKLRATCRLCLDPTRKEPWRELPTACKSLIQSDSRIISHYRRKQRKLVQQTSDNPPTPRVSSMSPRSSKSIPIRRPSTGIKREESAPVSKMNDTLPLFSRRGRKTCPSM